MSTVLAYLDPGSGSMILHIIAGGLAVVAATARRYWNRILRFLRTARTSLSPRRRPSPADRLRLDAPRSARRARSTTVPLDQMTTGTPSTSQASLEPGSFRDPESRVFYSGDESTGRFRPMA